MVVDKKWKGIFPLKVFSAASGFFDLPDWLVYKATGSATRCHRKIFRNIVNMVMIMVHKVIMMVQKNIRSHCSVVYK